MSSQPTIKFTVNGVAQTPSLTDAGVESLLKMHTHDRVDNGPDSGFYRYLKLVRKDFVYRDDLYQLSEVFLKVLTETSSALPPFVDTGISDSAPHLTAAAYCLTTPEKEFTPSFGPHRGQHYDRT
ncbi:hypothetical protein [Pseudomonas yamanorum]